MSKVIVNYNINDIFNRVNAVYIDNNVKFSDADFFVKYDFEKLLLKRENNEYILLIDFKNKKYVYELKKLNQCLNFSMMIKSLNYSRNYIDVIYDIDGQKFKFYLEIEEIK